MHGVSTTIASNLRIFQLQQVQDNVSLSNDEQSVLDTWLERASFRSQFTPATAADAVRSILCYYVFDSRMSQLQAIAVSQFSVRLQRTVLDSAKSCKAMFDINVT